MKPIVHAIFIAPKKGAPMQPIQSVLAIARQGLEGDRYAEGTGRYSREKNPNNRQVTLASLESFRNTNFHPHECRRNIITQGIDLMTLLRADEEVRIQIGYAFFRIMKYCDPKCGIPGTLVGKPGFAEQFFERGGVVAEILPPDGMIKVGDEIIRL